MLRDVSFTIEPGETVAIVGHTGAGKTTIISLLLRFYDVQKGAIRIDGVDIREWTLPTCAAALASCCRIRSCSPARSAATSAWESSWIKDEQVEKAADRVNVADFIRSLPDGFNEEVRERGSTLSTGQKQLISFARALAHDPEDPDPRRSDLERRYRNRVPRTRGLGRMVEGRTSLIIAHRLSTIQRADKIIVMHKGQVREMGTHQELLAKRGIYWKLYQLQYKDQELGVPGEEVSADD